MKIAIIQFAPVLGDKDQTINKLKLLLRDCSKANVVLLPELANSGYNFTNREMAINSSEPVNEKSIFLSQLIRICRQNQQFIVTGFNEREGDILFNSAILIGPEGIMGKYRKLHLFMNEKDYFEPGNLGLPVFDIGIAKIGMLICFDWMFPEAWRILAMNGVQIICHPSNLVLPYAQKAVTTHAITNRVFVATANRIGTEGTLTFTGQSVIVSPTSDYLAMAGNDKEEIIWSEIDPTLANNKNITPRNHVFDDRRNDVYENFI